MLIEIWMWCKDALFVLLIAMTLAEMLHNKKSNFLRLLFIGLLLLV